MIGFYTIFKLGLRLVSVKVSDTYVTQRKSALESAIALIYKAILRRVMLTIVKS